MSNFNGLKDILDTEESGCSLYTSMRKFIGVATSADCWYDTSFSSGNPKPNYYASTPLIGTQLTVLNTQSINSGGHVSPQTKFLRKTCFSISSAVTPIVVSLLDYLYYYPFIDEADLNPQFLNNTMPLPRYETGEGVRAMIVSTAPRASNSARVQISYTNQNGVSGRIINTTFLFIGTANGTVLTVDGAGAVGAGNVNQFIPLLDADTGVRSIESVTMLVGDVGLFTIVLVRPIASSVIIEQTAPVEVDYLKDKSQMPIIKDNACLGVMLRARASLSGAVLLGNLTYTWK